MNRFRSFQIRIKYFTWPQSYYSLEKYILIVYFRCIGDLERKGRDSLFAIDAINGNEGIKKRQKQQEKEDLVTQSGKATDNLTAISRQLAETVER